MTGVSEEEVARRATRRLLRAGYRPDVRSPGAHFRGNPLGSFFSSDPSRIMTIVNVSSVDRGEGVTVVDVSMEVHLAGQIATTSDMAFWRHELDSLSHELRTGDVTPYNSALARRAGRLGVWVPVMCVLAPMFPVASLALWSGLSLALVILYLSLSLGLMVSGIAWLRKGMPSVEALSVEAPLKTAPVVGGGSPERGAASSDSGAVLAASKSRRWEAPELAEDAEARAWLELEDFDRRLHGNDESIGESAAQEVEEGVAQRWDAW